MDRRDALRLIAERATDLGYDLKACRLEELTEAGDGDRLWKLTPPNGDPPLREYFDPAELPPQIGA
jgi:hypothetical protein